MSAVLPALVDTTATRAALHHIAEHVLAAEQHSAIGKLGLFVTPDGFGTRWFAEPGAEERRIRLAGARIIRETRSGITSDEILDANLDAEALAVLYSWWALGDRVLGKLAARDGEELSPITLWPEHFDIATTMTLASDSVNLGFSPGDEFCAEPYVYAGPWTAHEGPFWNAPFGAFRTYTDVAAEPALADGFLAEALDLLRTS